jgi:hypothetical protein
MSIRPGRPARRHACIQGRLTTLAAALVTAGAVVGCGGGGGDTTVQPTLSIELAGGGQGTVTGTSGGLNCSNAGGASAGPTCQATVAEGTQVTLTAAPADGSTFTGWGGNGVSCPVGAPCAVTVTSSRTVTAAFEPSSGPQTLTITGAGSGSGVVISDPVGINCSIVAGVAGATGCSATFPIGTSVELQVQSGSLVGFGGACSGTSCSVTMSQPRAVIVTFTPDAQATQLAFVVQPSAVQVNQAIAPPVQVAIEDAGGQPVPGRTDAVTLAIGTNPGGATLGGTVTQAAVNGIATFGNLTLNQVSDGYTLTASAAGLTPATSATFNVSTLPVAVLAFSVQPTNTTAGTPITPAVKVEIRDGTTNAVLTSRTDPITVSLQANPGGGTLGGTLTATAVAGVATFSNLTLQKAAAGYKLAVATPNAAGAVSNSFDIAAGAPVQFLINSSATQSAPVNTAVPERPSVAVRDAFNNPVAGVPVKWTVTAGGGTVVASTTDPVNRPTGPLGLSTAVSWTLGPDVGTLNNSLQASTDVAGITGSPVTFKASGTIPPTQGVFTGLLKKTSSAGFIDPPVPIGDAQLVFTNLNTAGTATVTTNSDGSFISPPLPAGDPFKIDITANTYKPITYQKPALTAGLASPLGDLGMVTDNPNGGQSTHNVTVNLDPPPAVVGGVHALAPIPVQVEVYEGYYFGDTDRELAIGFDNQHESGSEFQVEAGDWGVMTIRASAEGYKTATVNVVVDQPNGSETVVITLTK